MTDEKIRQFLKREKACRSDREVGAIRTIIAYEVMRAAQKAEQILRGAGLSKIGQQVSDLIRADYQESRNEPAQ